MRGVPLEVMEQARKAAACLEEMETVQVRHGLYVDRDYDCIAEVHVADAGDIESLKGPMSGFSFFLGSRGGKQWYCRERSGRRVVADDDIAFLGDGERFKDDPAVQWEWLDEESA